MSKIEERLALLEHRMALLEAKKTGTEPRSNSAEKILSTVGLAYLAEYTSRKIMNNPHFDEYDDLLQGIYSCKITQENRLEYADKLGNASLSLLDSAVVEYKKQKVRE